jgi:hypothetical protein
MDAPAKVGPGLVNLDRAAAIFDIVIEKFAPRRHALRDHDDVNELHPGPCGGYSAKYIFNYCISY